MNACRNSAAHRGPDDRGVEGVDPLPDQDEPGPADGLRGPDQGAQVALGADRLEHDPAEARPRRGSVQRRPPLGHDGPDAGGAVRPGDLAEGLGRDPERRGARPAAVADEPAGDGDGEELVAVDEGVDAVAVLDGLDDVPHALDEEPLAGIAVRAVGMEPSDLIERGCGIGLVSDRRGLSFGILLSGEPWARYEDEEGSTGHGDPAAAVAIRRTRTASVR